MNVWLVENGDGYHGRIKGTSEQTLRENILAIVDSIEDCKARTTVLSIINYLIQLYKTASDAGSPNAFGTAAMDSYMESQESYQSLFEDKAKYDAIMNALAGVIYREMREPVKK